MNLKNYRLAVFVHQNFQFVSVIKFLKLKL